MTKKIICFMMLISLFMVLVSPGCKSLTWDPTGSWLFTITYPAWSLSWVENLTLLNGQVTGFIFDGYISGTVGTYTLIDDFTLTIHFDYWRSGVNDIWNINLTSSEDSPNNMTGTGTVQYVGWYTDNFTVTAVKTTNLQ